MIPLLSLLNVFGGCCTNVFVLEKLVRRFHGCGELLTFTQYVFVAVVSFVWMFSRKRRSNPFSHDKVKSALVPSILALVVATLNNYVWVYKISVPLHTIVRSSGTVMSLLIGVYQGKRYTPREIAGVVLILIGTIISTLARTGSDSTPTSVVGLSILFAATFLAAVQTTMATGTKLQVNENMILMHVLPLPLFILLGHRINRQWQSLDSAAVLQLLCTCATQYFCLQGVFMLFKHGAVTVNVALSVRKFVSLGISAITYKDLPPKMIAGGCLVFVGAGVYSAGKAAIAGGAPDKVPQSSGKTSQISTKEKAE